MENKQRPSIQPTTSSVHYKSNPWKSANLVAQLHRNWVLPPAAAPPPPTPPTARAPMSGDVATVKPEEKTDVAKPVPPPPAPPGTPKLNASAKEFVVQPVPSLVQPVPAPVQPVPAPLQSAGIHPNLVPREYLMIDVEACDPAEGPILAIGIVRARYTRYKRQFVDYFQVAIERDRSEFTHEGWDFWQKPKHKRILEYLSLIGRGVHEQTALHQFLAYVNKVRKEQPDAMVLIDAWHVDGNLLNDALLAYGLPVLQTGMMQQYEPVPIVRDEMRGFFRLLNLDFVDLRQRHMYKAIQNQWNSLFSAEFKAAPGAAQRASVSPPNPRPAAVVTSHSDFNLSQLLQQKHVPVIDCLESLHMFFNTEDIRCWIQDRIDFRSLLSS